MRIEVIHTNPGQLEQQRETRNLFIFISKRLEAIMATLDDLKAKVAELTAAQADHDAKLDAFIASDQTLFQALKDALANGTSAGIQDVITQMEALRATITASSDKVVAADAADNVADAQRPAAPPSTPAP